MWVSMQLIQARAAVRHENPEGFFGTNASTLRDIGQIFDPMENFDNSRKARLYYSARHRAN